MYISRSLVEIKKVRWSTPLTKCDGLTHTEVNVPIFCPCIALDSDNNNVDDVIWFLTAKYHDILLQAIRLIGIRISDDCNVKIIQNVIGFNCLITV